ncbi:MAG: hypothetical protein WCR83_01495, partial [Candidatus Methanomethylophilaceae archaeon]
TITKVLSTVSWTDTENRRKTEQMSDPDFIAESQSVVQFERKRLIVPYTTAPRISSSLDRNHGDDDETDSLLNRHAEVPCCFDRTYSPP